MTIPAPNGLAAIFQVGDDTMIEPVVAFNGHGNAMVVNLETGELYVASKEHNFVSLSWDSLVE